MQDLTPAGLTEDGTCLLLVTATGEKFLLPVDDQVQRLVGSSRRTATSPDPGSSPPPPRQQEQTMDSALRPRDIQARVRAGESAETVAAAAGTSVEAIMPYASPVLAERAHQAQVALRASVRRGAGPAGGARTLGDAVGQFLAAHGLADDDVAWDSWRRPDGRWALTAQVQAGGRTHEAAFVHDVAGRYVVAENEDAKALTGEAGPAPQPQQPAPRRLSAVSDHGTSGDPDSLGDDAIALVRDRREEPTVLDSPLDRAPRDAADEPTVEVGADPADAALDDDPLQDPLQEPLDEEPDAQGAPAAQDVTEPDDQPALDLGVADPDPAPDPADKSKRGKRGRASVPSWDEIMFGGGTAGGGTAGGGSGGSGGTGSSDGSETDTER